MHEHSIRHYMMYEHSIRLFSLFLFIPVHVSRRVCVNFRDVAGSLFSIFLCVRSFNWFLIWTTYRYRSLFHAMIPILIHSKTNVPGILTAQLTVLYIHQSTIRSIITIMKLRSERARLGLLSNPQDRPACLSWRFYCGRWTYGRYRSVTIDGACQHDVIRQNADPNAKQTPMRLNRKQRKRAGIERDSIISNPAESKRRPRLDGHGKNFHREVKLR
jgi:hypothetical protein